MTFRNGTGKPLWIVSRYSPAEHLIEYVIVSEVVLTRLRCQVTPVDAGTSRATVTYQWTALAPAGAVVVEEHSAHFDAMLAEWDQEMNRVLASAKP